MVEETETTETVEADSIISKADAAASRLEAANDRMEKNIARQEALQVKNTLGGVSSSNVEPPKEESAQDYAAKVLSGDVSDKE